MPEVTFLGPQALAQLKEIARRVLREEQGANFGRAGRQHDSGGDVFIMKTSTAGIGTLSGNTAGSGSATIYYRNGSGTLTQFSTLTLTVYNVTTTSVSGSVYIQAKRDNFGALYVDVAPCST